MFEDEKKNHEKKRKKKEKALGLINFSHQ